MSDTATRNEWPPIGTIPQWHTLMPVLSQESMYSAAKTGELRVVRRGRRILVPRSAILEWIGESE